MAQYQEVASWLKDTLAEEHLRPKQSRHLNMTPRLLDSWYKGIRVIQTQSVLVLKIQSQIQEKWRNDQKLAYDFIKTVQFRTGCFW